MTLNDIFLCDKTSSAPQHSSSKLDPAFGFHCFSSDDVLRCEEMVKLKNVFERSDVFAFIDFKACNAAYGAVDD